MKTKLMILIAAFLLTAAAFSPATHAAYFEITASVKSAFEQVKGSADAAQADRMQLLYNELLTAQEQDQQANINIPQLHYENEENLIQLNKEIKLIDAERISKLEVQLKQTRERYKPLFALYTSLNQQMTAARTLKDKKLNSVLRTQADGMKFTVQLARQDIRKKEGLLKTAKDNKTKTVKIIRNTLAGIATIKVQIRSERSAINLPKAQISVESKNFSHALKQRDVISTLHSMTSLHQLLRQIIDQKKKIYMLETKIRDILLKAKSQIP